MRLLIWLVCGGIGAHAATFTSIRDGYWSNAATWGGSGVPGAGDTAIVRHTVIVDQNVTVGHSPSNDLDTIPAIHIQHTSSAISGQLFVSPGLSFTVRGDIRLESNGTLHRALLQLEHGVRFQFDASFAILPSAPVYRIYAVSASGNYSRVYVNGTPEDRVVIRSVKDNEASNGMFLEQKTASIDFRAFYADFEDCGTTSKGCIEHNVSSGNGNDRIEMEHIVMRRTSGIKPNSRFASSPNKGGDIFVLRDVKTFDTITHKNGAHPQMNGSLMVSTSVPVTTGIREISNCYFDNGFGALFVLAGFTIRDSVFDRSYPGANGIITAENSWALFENNVIRNTSTVAHAVGGSMKDVYYYADSRIGNPGNPHGLTVGVRADTEIDGLIFEYGDNPADPNGLVQQPYPATGGPWRYRYTWKNILMLPSSFFPSPTKTSSILINAGAAGACPEMVLEHNTFMISGNIVQTNYLNEVGIAQPYCIKAFRSNLAWDVQPGRSYMFTINSFRSRSPANAVDPEWTDYNACWNCMVTSPDRWPDSTSNSTVYDVPTTGATPGSRDLVNVDPQFVDPGRNIKRWVETHAGMEANTGTVSHAMYYLAHGPGTMREKITGLISWVREGFAPRNPLYKGTAHDGGDIGAVPVAPFGAP